MKRMWSTAIVVAMASAAGLAQSAAEADMPSKSGGMNMTYTGCVESWNHGAAFLLTRVGDTTAKPMAGDMAIKNHGDMTLKHDADTMMKTDAMPSTLLVLTGSTDLKKHVGQKVSVTGTVSSKSMGSTPPDRSMLTVKSLKVVAKSCM